MTNVSIEKLKKFLPDGSQAIIAERAKTTPVSVSRAWNASQKWQIAEETRGVILQETKRLFLELYDTEMRELAKAIRKEMTVSHS